MSGALEAAGDVDTFAPRRLERSRWATAGDGTYSAPGVPTPSWRRRTTGIVAEKLRGRSIVVLSRKKYACADAACPRSRLPSFLSRIRACRAGFRRRVIRKGAPDSIKKYSSRERPVPWKSMSLDLVVRTRGDAVLVWP